MKPEQLEQMLAKASKSVQRLNADLRRACPDPSPATASVPSKTRIRQSSKPLLNQLERQFKAWYELTTGYKLMCQAMRWRLGNGIWYCPDFTHFNGFGRMTCIEVKGPHAFRGGFENLKVACSLYPDFSWKLWWKQNGQWHCQNVLP